MDFVETVMILNETKLILPCKVMASVVWSHWLQHPAFSYGLMGDEWAETAQIIINLDILILFSIEF